MSRSVRCARRKDKWCVIPPPRGSQNEVTGKESKGAGCYRGLGEKRTGVSARRAVSAMWDEPVDSDSIHRHSRTNVLT